MAFSFFPGIFFLGDRGGMGVGSGNVGGGGWVGRGWGLGVQGKTGNAAAFCNLFIFSFERVKGRDRYLKPGVWPGYLGPG